MSSRSTFQYPPQYGQVEKSVWFQHLPPAPPVSGRKPPKRNSATAKRLRNSPRQLYESLPEEIQLQIAKYQQGPYFINKASKQQCLTTVKSNFKNRFKEFSKWYFDVKDSIDETVQAKTACYIARSERDFYLGRDFYVNVNCQDIVALLLAMKITERWYISNILGGGYNIYNMVLSSDHIWINVEFVFMGDIEDKERGRHVFQNLLDDLQVPLAYCMSQAKRKEFMINLWWNEIGEKEGGDISKMLEDVEALINRWYAWANS